MKTTRLVLIALTTALVAGFAGGSNGAAVQNPRPRPAATAIRDLVLPPGFAIDVYADHVDGARSLSLSPHGVLYVGTRSVTGDPGAGRVYAVRDTDGDGHGETVTVVAGGLQYPNGVAWHDGDLYVAEISRIMRYRDIDNHLDHPPPPDVIGTPWPREFAHGWKYIAFGPDGRLYVPVGAPCNVCVPDQEHGGIWRINADGSGRENFARGIRNTVGFAWQPGTGELWFADNGRDEWGDDRPPEELNRAPAAGLHFGYPYRYGKTMVDDTFPAPVSGVEFTPAALEMPAHRAPLGIQFYTGTQFPARFRDQLFLAHHGSWNRSGPDGFRVSLVTIAGDKVTGYEDFITGWLKDGAFWGRPVDMEMTSDGSLLLSDDFAGVIYRIRYNGPAAP